MTRTRVTAALASLAGAALVVAAAGTGLTAQKMTAADSAAKFSGTWKMNRALSPGLAPAAPARGGGGGAAPTGGSRPLSPVALSVKPSTTFERAQRGGGRDGGQDSGGATAAAAGDKGEEAIRALQAVPETLKITATADSVTFEDSRGVRTYAVTDKNVKMDLGGGVTLTERSKWDKTTLSQTFSYGETSLQINWDLNAAGNQMTFHLRKSNLGSTDSRFTEVKAVYDKQ